MTRHSSFLTNPFLYRKVNLVRAILVEIEKGCSLTCEPRRREPFSRWASEEDLALLPKRTATVQAANLESSARMRFSVVFGRRSEETKVAAMHMRD